MIVGRRQISNITGFEENSDSSDFTCSQIDQFVQNHFQSINGIFQPVLFGQCYGVNVSSCFSRNIVVIKYLSISIESSQYYSKSCQMYKYLYWNKYIVCVFNFDYVGFSVSPKFRHKTDTFKLLIRVVLATLSPTFEALLYSTCTWDDLSYLERCLKHLPLTCHLPTTYIPLL